MVWYGGIPLTTDAFHVSLDIEYRAVTDEDDGIGIQGVEQAFLRFGPLISKLSNEESHLIVPDRFFYN